MAPPVYLLSTGFAHVPHRIATGYTQPIHKLYTRHTQVIHKASLSVPHGTLVIHRLSTGCVHVCHMVLWYTPNTLAHITTLYEYTG